MPPPRRVHKVLTINVILIASVALLVLIFIIATAPSLMSHEEVPVEVPKTIVVETQTEDHMTIAISPANKLALDDKPISTEKLQEAIQYKLSQDPYYLIIIRADKDAHHAWVLEMLSMTKEAGAKRVAIATKKKTKKEE